MPKSGYLSSETMKGADKFRIKMGFKKTGHPHHFLNSFLSFGNSTENRQPEAFKLGSLKKEARMLTTIPPSRSL